ncbi:MAG TPA: ion channel [Stellaceae bacterium]|nr:ion channel [Stellaceae bacterium]
MQVGGFEYTKSGVSRFDLRDLYHLAVTLRWPHFFLGLLAVELVVNTLFALLYLVDPNSIANARPGSFVDNFFFSVETLATVGYGVMAPATLYGHVVSAVEIITGMTFTAIFTGLIFVRFSRPKAKIMFADCAVVTRYNGRPTLMVRLANGRLTVLADASIQIGLILFEQSAEGASYRRVHQLKLDRTRLPLFALTWTVMHPIDEESPLFGYTERRFADTEARLFLAVEARDPSMGAQVHALKDYDASHILVGRRYQDAVTRDEKGRPFADLTRLSDTEPDESFAAAADAAAAKVAAGD